MRTSHARNQGAADRLTATANRLGLHIRHNSSGLGGFDGYHRYLVLDGREAKTNESTRSKTCLDYWETRYSSHFQPSIRGERECLEDMEEFLVRHRFQEMGVSVSPDNVNTYDGEDVVQADGRCQNCGAYLVDDSADPTESEQMSEPKKRLEELRVVLRAENISWGELHELQSLAEHIDEGDVELLEAAGVHRRDGDDQADGYPDDDGSGLLCGGCDTRCPACGEDRESQDLCFSCDVCHDCCDCPVDSDGIRDA